MTSTTAPRPPWLKRTLLAAGIFRPKAAATAGSAATVQPAPAGAPSAPPLALLAAALRAPHGASPEELAAAIAGNKARPDLDPELVDDDGFPIVSARSDAAVDDAVREDIREWLVLASMAELQLGEAQWRALILGTAVVRDLASEAFMQLMPENGTAPQLRLMPILPLGWTSEQRHAAGLWFKHTVAQCGWPVDHLTRIDVAPDAAPAAILGQCALDSQVPNKGVATMLVACDSHIDQETVDRWIENRTLFTSAQPHGLVPGEGAAGLLMTNLSHAQSLPDVAFTLLDPLKEARLPASADENWRSDASLLSGLVQLECREANVELPTVRMIVADTGQRAHRVRELMEVVSSAFPHLDDKTDVACVGISSGSCGAVPYMTALALAQHQAGIHGTPVLYVSNEEAHIRYAALVCPMIPRS